MNTTNASMENLDTLSVTDRTPQSAEVKLLGQKIHLKTTDMDPEVLRQVIQLASSKLDEVTGRVHGMAPHQIALLALLNLAEEYVRAKKRTLDFQSEVNTKSTQLLNLIEAELK